jgi:hypothetical protein
MLLTARVGEIEPPLESIRLSVPVASTEHGRPTSGYRFRAARVLVIVLRTAFAAVVAFSEAFFTVDFERFIIVATPTTSAPAIAGKKSCHVEVST